MSHSVKRRAERLSTSFGRATFTTGTFLLRQQLNETKCHQRNTHTHTRSHTHTESKTGSVEEGEGGGGEDAGITGLYVQLPPSGVYTRVGSINGET